LGLKNKSPILRKPFYTIAVLKHKATSRIATPRTCVESSGIVKKEIQQLFSFLWVQKLSKTSLFILKCAFN